VGPLRIVYAGRLSVRQKQIHKLFDSVTQYLHENPASRFTIVGQGAEQSLLEQRVKENPCGSRISLLGPVKPWDIHDELVKHNVLVLMSDFEGTPGAVMDAMACGLVPVCLDLPGGLRELVRHRESGIIVTNRDEDFWAKMRELESDEELRRTLSSNARSLVAREFSLQHVADLWESFLVRLDHSVSSCLKCEVSIPRFPILPRPKRGFGAEDRRHIRYVFDRCGKLTNNRRREFGLRMQKVAWDSRRNKFSRLVALCLSCALCPQLCLLSSKTNVSHR